MKETFTRFKRAVKIGAIAAINLALVTGCEGNFRADGFRPYQPNQSNQRRDFYPPSPVPSVGPDRQPTSEIIKVTVKSPDHPLLDKIQYITV